jgi:hypothetical protein
VPWGSPDVLWLWIMDYVRLNRVEQAFAAAFELLGVVATQPRPSYQESSVWHKAVINVNLAQFSPVRARVPSNLRGEPNIPDMNATSIMVDETRAPSNYLIVSAVLNYASWVGIYGLVANHSRDMMRWQDAVSGYDSELAILNTPESHSALISLITGKEIFTCLNTNCHVTYDLSGMAGMKSLAVDKVIEPGYADKLMLDYLPSYVSGSLLLGAVACQLDCLAHLHGTYSFDVSEYNDVDPIDACKAASTYRLFGHDLQVVHIKSHEVYPVYANVADATVATYELLGRSRDFDRMRLLSSDRRPGRSSDLPPAQSLSTYGAIHVTIEKPVLSVAAWQRRGQVMRPTVVLQGRRQAIEFKVGNSSQYRTAHFNVGRPKGVVSQGFRERNAEPAPAMPTQSTGDVGIMTADHTAIEQHAEDVE